MSLLETVKERTELATGMTLDELKALATADRSVLRDPFEYKGMSDLVDKLHAFKQLQDQDPSQLLVIDTDYDTDGVMSAAVLSAALDVFNINFRIYVPSMADGYGLSPKAVRDMTARFNQNGYQVSTILTADNGTNAIAGVEEAKLNGIHVLVTDHHLGSDDYSQADVIVNPNQKGDTYSFKGNAGAAVAWKAMMAYASRYDQPHQEMIYDLIVFAGIANVSDVMPILDENHFMVKEAVSELKRLVHIHSLYDPSVDPEPYKEIKDSPYIHYNTVFRGLYDMVSLLQESKDEKRKAQNKKPIPLTTDEELIGWYLSPMINAPRRIHATSVEAMLALMETRANMRETNIKSMIEMNAQKSELRNRVTDELDWDDIESRPAAVVFVNAEHGISGLVAGQITSTTNRAAMVFSLPTRSETIVYSDHQFDERFDAADLVIAASARSTAMQPLNVIMARIQEIRPDIIVGGGGHAQAAGYSIYYKHLEVFRTLFENVAQQVEDQIRKEYEEQVAQGLIQPTYENVVRLSMIDLADTPEYAVYNIAGQKNLAKDMMDVDRFQHSLKPFGKDFEGQTTFEITFNPLDLTDPEYNLNLDFWKTLKFNLYGIDVLTFNIKLADGLKAQIAENNPAVVTLRAKLEMNEFRGRITPQLQLL